MCFLIQNGRFNVDRKLRSKTKQNHGALRAYSLGFRSSLLSDQGTSSIDFRNVIGAFLHSRSGRHHIMSFEK